MESFKTRQSAFLVSNLHCASCCASIEKALWQLAPPPLSLSHSILDHTITVNYPTQLPTQTIKQTLENEGYKVDAIIDNPLSQNPKILSEDNIASDPERERPESTQLPIAHTSLEAMQERHRANCKQCQLEQSDAASYLPEKALVGDGKSTSFVAIESPFTPKTYVATLTLDGMTCASCVSNITRALEANIWVESVNVSLLTNSATVVISGKEHAEALVPIIEDAGYDAALDGLEEANSSSKNSSQPALADVWKATYSIGGMTCSSCISTITRALQEYPWVQNVDINLVAGSAVVVFMGKSHLQEIASRIEDIGYEANLDVVTEAAPVQQIPSAIRTVQIRVEGMYCEHCPGKIMAAISQVASVKIDQVPSLRQPVLRIMYAPDAPALTIRDILAAISNADPAFHPYIHHSMSMEERSQQMHVREQKKILYRLIFSFVVAIPTFIIGVAIMSLVPKQNSARKYLMGRLGGPSRAEWALLIMATPVYFFGADVFHLRMIKELRALWRRRSPTPIGQRFYRFGSMNMLISLGTTIAFISSIIEMAVNATQTNIEMQERGSPTYFDSVVFLTMFLLIGRYIEAHSKARTGDAVAALGKLRPTTALLQTADADDSESERSPDAFQTVGIDLVDRGDVVRVPHGASPPCDGIVIAGTSKFDESSLTGESRPVTKQVGDGVYSGTVNQGGAISIRVTGVAGNSMLDQIMRVVREGQARRAPIERVADRITGYFVPFICLVAIVTWIVWLGLGTTGKLPLSWRDTADNWPFWSLQFAIAVFVVACPCGIGLAAPTALFVGGGLAANFGILVKGGGEAFQEASNLDCIVFDKTGTLTQGGEPVVTDFIQVGDYPDVSLGEENIVSLASVIEEDSSHPLAKAIVNFGKIRQKQAHGVATTQESTEVPGRGMKGIALLSGPSTLFEQGVQILVGNEKLMEENEANMPPGTASTLDNWKRQGKSVVLVALNMRISQATGGTHGWWVVAIYAVSDPIRPEAPHVVKALQKKKIEVWMISGDNHITAYAIGDKLGIGRENIIAGVLPEQKASKIKELQSCQSKHGPRRATVAMVGDGINDSPALTNADVGIAIGSGSDVAINAASFVLLTSELTSMLTLIDLSRSVFRRIKFNFFWALVYNLAALPIAAGVFYPVTTAGGHHVRLDPVWAALAMALSSVSVVCSSLLLRSKLPFVGFRRVERWID
jgi:Cu+-exporting ATPase